MLKLNQNVKIKTVHYKIFVLYRFKYLREVHFDYLVNFYQKLERRATSSIDISPIVIHVNMALD